ncbi:MAG: flavodoxin family protein [Planctomycetes bacterium]|nr:flavodoxin family protein [Planctomycetota bacterium]
MSKKILGIVGSYRKGGTIDSLVTEVLAAAQEHGAETTKIYLLDQRIEFCTNCRQCTQQPGTEPGDCVHEDDMASILAQYEGSAAVVLGAPVNFFNVNAITRRFLERLVCFTYWPWGALGPKMRRKAKTRKAVLITSSAMPGAMVRMLTGAPRALRLMAATMGAKPVATVLAGLSAKRQQNSPSERLLRKARAAGRKLAGG